MVLHIRQNRVKILCLCYTNHALDQFLEGLLDSGITKIARIGSRSKSERLKGYIVRNLARNDVKFDKEQNRQYYQLNDELEWHRDAMNEATESLSALDNLHYDAVMSHLQHSHPDVFKQFVMPELDEGFERADKKKNRKDYLWKLWIRGKKLSPDLQHGLNEKSGKIWLLPKPRRYERARLWLQDAFDEAKTQAIAASEGFSGAFDALKCLKQSSQRLVLKDADVIGATTSGATNMKELLESSGAEVVIVEEAGEVLEAHVLTSISSVVQHLILIGDHKQLRPKVQTYDLQVVSKRGFDLDRSLFERLVLHSGMRPALLNVQRRMRPEYLSSFEIRTQSLLITKACAITHILDAC